MHFWHQLQGLGGQLTQPSPAPVRWHVWQPLRLQPLRLQPLRLQPLRWLLQIHSVSCSFCHMRVCLTSRRRELLIISWMMWVLTWNVDVTKNSSKLFVNVRSSWTSRWSDVELSFLSKQSVDDSLARSLVMRIAMQCHVIFNSNSWWWGRGFESHPLPCRVRSLAHLPLSPSSILWHYWTGSDARKVTAGLAWHWPCVTAVLVSRAERL